MNNIRLFVGIALLITIVKANPREYYQTNGGYYDRSYLGLPQTAPQTAPQTVIESVEEPRSRSAPSSKSLVQSAQLWQPERNSYRNQESSREVIEDRQKVVDEKVQHLQPENTVQSEAIIKTDDTDDHSYDNGGSDLPPEVINLSHKATHIRTYGHDATRPHSLSGPHFSHRGQILIHRPPPIVVRRPPTKVVVNHPPLVVKPAPVVFHRPAPVIVRPVYVKAKPQPVKVQPVYVKVVTPQPEDREIKQTYGHETYSNQWEGQHQQGYWDKNWEY